MSLSDQAATERVEHQALDAWFDSASTVATGRRAWTRQVVGDACCYVAADEPSILVNRVLGLGSSGRPPSSGQLAEIREIYADAGVARFFLHVVPDAIGPERHELLAEAGFQQYRGWMKFSRGSGDIRPITTDLSIRQIGPDSAEDFAAIAGPAFDFLPDFQPTLACLVNAPGWRVFMSFDGKTPAGTGAVFMRDGVAYLDFGATHPDFRRRGAQSGVLSARLQAAIDAGCHSVITMTGEAVPGDEQHSYRNIMRAGFAPLYLRENWIPADG